MKPLLGTICACLIEVGVTAVLLNLLEILDFGYCCCERSERAWVEEGSNSAGESEGIFIFCKRLMK
jgi:hypothetical protein